MKFLTVVAALIAGIILMTSQAWAANSNPDALWNIVQSCVNEQQQHADPKPCVLVNLRPSRARGFAVLKDIRGATQYLLLPTQRITGIEDPQLLAPRVTNYFDEAWKARTYVEKAAHRQLPRTSVGLAVNSQPSRGQNQLHVHIDCVREDVESALASRTDKIGRHWAPLGVALGKSGHQYLAMRVNGTTLGRNNPFNLLADGVPDAHNNMGQHTLAVIGIYFHGKPGFVLLDYQMSDPGDWAAGEELLDHNRCAPTTPAPESH